MQLKALNIKFLHKYISIEHFVTYNYQSCHKRQNPIHKPGSVYYSRGILFTQKKEHTDNAYKTLRQHKKINKRIWIYAVHYPRITGDRLNRLDTIWNYGRRWRLNSAVHGCMCTYVHTHMCPSCSLFPRQRG